MHAWIRSRHLFFIFRVLQVVKKESVMFHTQNSLPLCLSSCRQIRSPGRRWRGIWGKISRRRQLWRVPFRSWSHVSHRIHLIEGASLPERLSIIRSPRLCFQWLLFAAKTCRYLIHIITCSFLCDDNRVGTAGIEGILMMVGLQEPDRIDPIPIKVCICWAHMRRLRLASLQCVF
jgi:hypothetical protein